MATRNSPASRGSMRQQRSGSWQLRVYQGIDPATHRVRYATRTVRGSRRAAQRALRELAVEVDHARTHAGTVGDLLERWYPDASPVWPPTTTAHTRSILDRHLIPQLGHVPARPLDSSLCTPGSASAEADSRTWLPQNHLA